MTGIKKNDTQLKPTDILGLAQRGRRVPELKWTRKREASASPTRRSGSPDRRQQIAQLEKERNESLLENVSPKRRKLMETELEALRKRVNDLETKLQNQLESFIETNNKRFKALEEKLQEFVKSSLDN